MLNFLVTTLLLFLCIIFMGKGATNIGGVNSLANATSPIGSESNPAKNCQDLYERNASAQSGVFWLYYVDKQDRYQTYKTYCEHKLKEASMPPNVRIPDSLDTGALPQQPYDFAELHRDTWPRPIDPPGQSNLDQKLNTENPSDNRLNDKNSTGAQTPSLASEPQTDGSGAVDYLARAVSAFMNAHKNLKLSNLFRVDGVQQKPSAQLVSSPNGKQQKPSAQLVSSPNGKQEDNQGIVINIDDKTIKEASKNSSSATNSTTADENNVQDSTETTPQATENEKVFNEEEGEDLHWNQTKEDAKSPLPKPSDITYQEDKVWAAGNNGKTAIMLPRSQQNQSSMVLGNSSSAHSETKQDGNGATEVFRAYAKSQRNNTDGPDYLNSDNWPHPVNIILTNVSKDQARQDEYQAENGTDQLYNRLGELHDEMYEQNRTKQPINITTNLPSQEDLNKPPFAPGSSNKPPFVSGSSNQNPLPGIPFNPQVGGNIKRAPVQNVDAKASLPTNQIVPAIAGAGHFPTNEKSEAVSESFAELHVPDGDNETDEDLNIKKINEKLNSIPFASYGSKK